MKIRKEQPNDKQAPAGAVQKSGTPISKLRHRKNPYDSRPSSGSWNTGKNPQTREEN